MTFQLNVVAFAVLVATTYVAYTLASIITELLLFPAHAFRKEFISAFDKVPLTIHHGSAADSGSVEPRSRAPISMKPEGQSGIRQREETISHTSLFP